MFKIGIICPSDFSRKERSGGASGFLASIFSELRCSVAIYGVGLNNNQTWQEFHIQPNINFIPITNIKAPSLLPLRLQALIGYLRYRNRILQSKSDILYVHSPECALPFIFCNKRIPVIFHQHGSGNPVTTATFTWARNSVLAWIFDKIHQTIYRRADWIVAIDRLCLEQANKNGAADKTSLLMNAVDTKKFNPDIEMKSRMRKSCGLTSEDIAILFVGRLEELKQVDRLIKSLSILKEKRSVRLFLAGDGTQRDYLQRLVEELGLEQLVFFLGKIPHNRLPEYYNMADVLALPSKMEGVPMVILESLACGTPVLASAVGGIPDLVRTGENGVLLKDCSSESIADAALRIVEMTLPHEQVSSSIAEWSATRAAKKLADIFQKVLHR